MSKLNIKPLADRVLVEPLEAETKTASGIIIPDSAKEKPQKGNVVAVGVGTKENPITVKFGITDMEILPAGIKKEYSGHHHLLIDVEDLPDFSKPIPADKNHIHFGNGQTEVTIHLDQGTHTLQLSLIHI